MSTKKEIRHVTRLSTDSTLTGRFLEIRTLPTKFCELLSVAIGIESFVVGEGHKRKLAIISRIVPLTRQEQIVDLGDVLRYRGARCIWWMRIVLFHDIFSA